MEFLEKFVHKDLIENELEYSEIYFYLDKYMTSQIYTIEDLKEIKSVRQNHTSWIFWKQGMEQAPKLIQKCFDSVCRNKPKGFDIVLLSDDNLNDYIQLPDFIWEKYKKGYITTTHLSDIIRLELLCTYGGCWIDATVFCSGIIPDYMVNREMFLFKASKMDNVVLKMSSWWLTAEKSNRLVHVTRKILYSFWKQENNIRNYFLLHAIMSKLIDQDSLCKSIFYNIPYFNNGNSHVLHSKMPVEFDEEEWRIIKDISVIHKLSYKQRYLQGDIYNYYQALLDDKLR